MSLVFMNCFAVYSD